MILKAKLKFPDRFGSFVSQDKDEENVGSDNIFESGEELATFQPNGFELDREIGGDDYDHDDPSVLRQKQVKEVMATVSASEVIAADEKRSNLEYEVRLKSDSVGSSLFFEILGAFSPQPNGALPVSFFVVLLFWAFRILGCLIFSK